MYLSAGHVREIAGSGIISTAEQAARHGLRLVVTAVSRCCAVPQAADAVVTVGFSARGEAPGDAAPSVADGVLACRSGGRMTDGEFATLVDVGRAAAHLAAVVAKESLEHSLGALL